MYIEEFNLLQVVALAQLPNCVLTVGQYLLNKLHVGAYNILYTVSLRVVSGN